MNRRHALAGAAALLATRVSAASAAVPARGLWRDVQGAFGVGAFPEFGPGLFAFDYGASIVGPLTASSAEGVTLAGALDGSGPPLEALRMDGERLVVGARRLEPVAISRHAFTAMSGSLAISAELALAPALPRRGTVLMVYGSGPAPKAALDLWAMWFLAEGYAVLTYDKRGSGKTAGDWRLTGLEDLAADAAAVLKQARSQGLKGPVLAWGASQAGWILPQLSAAGLVDGLIMHACAATTPAEQILDQVDYSLRSFGFDAAEIQRAKSYYALDIDVSRGRRPWDEIDAACKASLKAGVEWILEPPAAATAPERTMIRLMADFDPAPFWHDSRVPVLALFGARDWIVPAETNLPRLRGMIPAGVDLDPRTIPDSNHLMFIAKTGNLGEYPKLSRLASGYFSAMTAWLGQRT